LELEEARRLVSIWVGADREKEEAVRMLVDEAVRLHRDQRAGEWAAAQRVFLTAEAEVERMKTREGQVAAHYRVGLAAVVNSLAFALGRQDWGQVGTVLERLKALAIELPPEEGR
jgi:hypothetical protein